MTLSVLLPVAVNSLVRHRLRAGLTTLGVAIGIAATLCTVALGEGSASVIHEDPAGQSVRLGSVPFTVVGVLRPKGQSATGQDQDDIIILPYTTAVVYLRRTPSIEDIMCSATSPEAIPDAKEHLSGLLRDRHRRFPGQD